MIESFKHLINLLLDSSKSWGFKTAAIISIIGFLVLSDISLNISYNIHLNNKISQLEKIQSLKDSYLNDSDKLNKILSIEKSIINKEHYSDFLSRIISQISFIQKSNQNKNPTTIPINPIRSFFWMTLSSNYLIALFFPFLLFVPLYGKDGRTANGIVGWIASLILLTAIASLITWVSYQIPIILDNPVWNYVLNFVIHSLFLFLIIKIAKTNKKN
jgi:hypothetical protein